MLQVANYGIGGRYTPHLDHGILEMKKGTEPNPEDSFRGERIATLMTYVRDLDVSQVTSGLRPSKIHENLL